jgi:EAL domain-containing protein (putative c-di-GMP-specific phosphodiesterase class I)/signal transduction histidine kinase/DNA-binding NarL/FixJ family response regulator
MSFFQSLLNSLIKKTKAVPNQESNKNAAQGHSNGQVYQRKSSIRQKLMWLVAGSVIFSTLPVAVLFTIKEVSRHAEGRWQNLKTAADVLASSTVEAVQNRDQTRAFEAIRAVSATPGVVYARVETWDGYALAENGAGARLRSNVRVEANKPPPSVSDLILTRTIQIEAPIVTNGITIGKVIVTHKSEGLGWQILVSLAGVLSLAIMALIIALIIAVRVQVSMTKPLLELTSFVAATRRISDFSRRLKVNANDEVGELIVGFNAMLEAVNLRDKRIAEHMKGLEAEVEARTQDFLEARDEAQAANAAKSDFLATMSHEIRTPMNGVLVMAELLAAENLPIKAKRHAATIAKSGRSLLAVINDILDFSKIEAGKLDVEIMPTDIVDVIDDAVGLFHAKAQEKGIELVCAVHRDAPRLVPADPVRLGQVVTNLISNALKFTETGHVLVRLLPDKGNGQWRLIVSDTGIGIAEDKLGKLFSAFVQEDQSTTRRFGGTGLGLSISKRLVEAMKGSIHVTSKQGVGTHFHVHMPMPASPFETAAPPRLGDDLDIKAALYLNSVKLREMIAHRLDCAHITLVDEGGSFVLADKFNRDAVIGVANPNSLILLAEADDTEADIWLKKKKCAAIVPLPFRHADLDRLIDALANGQDLSTLKQEAQASSGVDASYSDVKVLVVDDAEVNLEVALEALSRFAIKAETANNGLEALERSADTYYDLILMDGSMPVMDGYESSRRIRQREQETGSPAHHIVALTAHVVGDAAQAWREAGMNDVLHKPFTMTDLARILREAFGSERAGPPLEIDQEPLQDNDQNTVSNEDNPIWDEAVAGPLFAGLKNGRADFVNKVVGLYCSHAPLQLQAVRDAFEASDTESIAKAAHTLKGMSYNLGAKAVAMAAAQIENTIRIDNRYPDQSLIDALEPWVTATLSAIHARLRGEDVPALLIPKAEIGQLTQAPKPQDGLNSEELVLYESLKKAIEAGHFEMVYQPIFDRLGERVITAEALIRWHRQDGPPTGPAVFIPLAEKTGLIGELGAFARKRVLEQAISWNRVPIAINLSPLELGAVDFLDSLDGLISETGYDPSFLILEITETAFVAEPEKIRSILQAIRDRGIKLALDDFGSGYSSLTALHRFPFDKVKIDREFVAALDGDSKSALEALAIIQAVSGLGRAFGLQVVAEGIETKTQHHHLKAAGVHALQGYLFSKPLNANDFEDLLIQSGIERRIA